MEDLLGPTFPLSPPLFPSPSVKHTHTNCRVHPPMMSHPILIGKEKWLLFKREKGAQASQQYLTVSLSNGLSRILVQRINHNFGVLLIFPLVTKVSQNFHLSNEKSLQELSWNLVHIRHMQRGWVWGLKPLPFPKLIKGDPQHELTSGAIFFLLLIPLFLINKSDKFSSVSYEHSNWSFF